MSADLVTINPHPVRTLISNVERIGGFAIEVKALLGDEHWSGLVAALADCREELSRASTCAIKGKVD